ncbi:MAG: bifunctional diaminohydroxyphosphoribosylaminopyrimidine deaminase/5-amino-6-(5-phosphoribosylamino)uracil reductase RibD [Verrucomicrobia bacterium]|nr:bifunctional diaminohydroxyphosphoribosylaminopyrimidine deaminase/5-amino-6-(5-phosphoribosylamino)uracil reductase RibD [Verrucomicrobiota bacterium]
MSTDEETDARYMRLALRQARKGLGTTSPNPAVGAVIVRDGQVLAAGFHERAGGPHAEVAALAALQDPGSATGATLYVTLEPCSTFGRTPPCTAAILAAGIGRVVVGCIDPNPRHRGNGINFLQAHGIPVATGILEKECRDLNTGFNRWITTGRPWVIAKFAQSLDGRLTRPPGESTWLTSKRSRFRAQRLRATVDAILVGAETIRRDDPQLTVRVGRRHLQPWRVVVTRSGDLPAAARVFTDEYRERTLVFQNSSWETVLDDLGQRGVTRLLVEGGGKVLGQLRDLGLIDEVWSFFAPLLSGGPVVSVGGQGVLSNEETKVLIDVSYHRLGSDLLVCGKLKK